MNPLIKPFSFTYISNCIFGTWTIYLGAGRTFSLLFGGDRAALTGGGDFFMTTGDLGLFLLMSGLSLLSLLLSRLSRSFWLSFIPMPCIFLAAAASRARGPGSPRRPGPVLIPERLPELYISVGEDFRLE